jgi:hypothetical protein
MSGVGVQRKKEICCFLLSDYIKQNSVQIGFGSSDSWTILSPIEQSIKRKIEAVGTPLKDWDIRINFGIKTGCNEAFIISGEKRDEILRNCKNDTERSRTAELIRPILRGRDIKRYGYEWAGLYVITAYFGIHKILQADYPAVFEHLLQYREALENRGQCRYTSSGKPNTNAPYPGQHHWLELDNNPRREYLDDFSKQKIVWGEISDKPKFAYDDGQYFQEATTFLMTGSNPKYLLVFLNSQLSMYFFSKIGTTTGVGTVRWKKFKLEEFPIPPLTPERFALLVPLIDALLLNYSSELERKMNQAVYSIFNFTETEIAYIEGFQYD